jgi:hypothetical protein
MPAGDRVRLVNDPGRVGVLTGRERPGDRGGYAQVTFPDRTEWVPADQIESVSTDGDSPLDLFTRGRLAGPADLYRTLTHIRLSGKLANFIYSLETIETDFYAYQFKPIVKLLQSVSTGILVADEVGLGKTIEAGLIWTELRSRFDLQRLLVVCPAMLREKWSRELHRRFGVKPDILGAGEFLQVLREAAEGTRREFAVIASLQGLRPRSGQRPMTIASDGMMKTTAPVVGLRPLVAERQIADWLEQQYAQRNCLCHCFRPTYD